MITGNEPAMPFDVNIPIAGQGLTIRQHFAAMAMQGMLAAGDGDFNSDHVVKISVNAVKQADALITELNKTNI